ncbi:hypothetical protein ABZ553_05845 [Streptomyces sparsogenes]|uniref:hypothetical protein n=1 Tax=Streptomyces sparsogenes TaxID=67365 RepID=UPI00340DD953
MSISKRLTLAVGTAVLGGSLILPQATGSFAASSDTKAAKGERITTASPTAGLECGRNWPHHRSARGSVSGARAATHICWDNRYNARIDYSSSWVQDTSSRDRKAARAYVRYNKKHSGRWVRQWSGPLATDGPSRGVKHFQWGDSSSKGVVVYVCVGAKAPWQSGNRCKGF